MNLTFIKVLPNHLWLFYRCFTSSKLLSGVPEVCVSSLSRYGSERQRRGGRVCVLVSMKFTVMLKDVSGAA